MHIPLRDRFVPAEGEIHFMCELLCGGGGGGKSKSFLLLRITQLYRLPLVAFLCQRKLTLLHENHISGFLRFQSCKDKFIRWTKNECALIFETFEGWRKKRRGI
jgi:hypothetical protein